MSGFVTSPVVTDDVFSLNSVLIVMMMMMMMDSSVGVMRSDAAMFAGAAPL